MAPLTGVGFSLGGESAQRPGLPISPDSGFRRNDERLGAMHCAQAGKPTLVSYSPPAVRGDGRSVLRPYGLA